MYSKNNSYPLLYNKRLKKNRHCKIFILSLSILLGLVMLGFPRVAKADVWNYEAGFMKIYLSHFMQHSDKILSQDGNVLANPEKSGGFLQGGFLQYSSISASYNPTWQTELSIFLTLEKNRDEIGRPIPSSFTDSFNINALPQIIWEMNYGFLSQDTTPRLSLFYRMPTINFLQKDQTFGLRFSFPIATGIDSLTLVSSTGASLYVNLTGQSIISGGEVFQKLEIYQEIFNDAIQLNLFLEGVYSSWYYLKGGGGLYYPFNQYGKIGLHYINTFLGQWVIPSQGLLLSFEYYLNPL